MKSTNRKLAIFSVAFLLAALVGCAATPKHESTGEYVDDASITSRVKTEFVKNSQVKARDIKVDTYQGVVQLSGFADSQTEINRAVDIARNVSGVKFVKNDIQLKSNE